VEEFRTMTHQPTSSSERGGAGVKFLIIFVVLILAANAGYNYIPVAYAGESFRQEMQTAVVMASRCRDG
jgi:hypothetical protein